ncbi:enolase C-terminal domain-like protein [Nannocystis sp. SCPEA4]|uniref:enolase C-terminal domain-like protein n=1 Tax=Nannocystis sp. SCPEA4 TaxID=2996787 RepID=UPI002270C9B7|nr:enolase C-terminal domain-like protein [Nannocystis sp. SCPEA4]MCY1059045.1 mandelate racemase [Nannocystis sp. SCPEA4]
MARARLERVTVEQVTARAFTIPTDAPESDGTFAWDRTTLVLVRARAGGREGLGYTYAHAAAVDLAEGPLARAVVGKDAMATSASWAAMRHALRNLGRPGLGWEALSAVDVALWDLKAKLLDISLAALLGPARDDVPIYGSGGFTSYDDARLTEQLAGWVAEGITMVKMKVGRDPASDPHRVRTARRAIGPDVQLFVDANGAWSRKQALAQLAAFTESAVRWAEEPVCATDLDGLRLVRDRAPAGVEVAAGEYGYILPDFRSMLAADCLDVLMADGTRCGGITGLLAVAALAEAHDIPLSTHCAPQLHAHVGAALRPLRHLEYFHDHARIERLVFDGALDPRGGHLTPDLSRPGLGVEFREADAVPFAV